MTSKLGMACLSEREQPLFCSNQRLPWENSGHVFLDFFFFFKQKIQIQTFQWTTLMFLRFRQEQKKPIYRQPFVTSRGPVDDKQGSMAAVYSFQNEYSFKKPWQNLNCNQADPANQHSITPSLSHSDWLSYGHTIQRSSNRVSSGTFGGTTMKEAPHFF